MLRLLKTFFEQLKFKAMSRQLRKPTGAIGRKTGLLMNKANSFLYDATLQEMNLINTDAVLEIGFGNGMFFDKIFKQTPGITITGIDYAPSMVYEARKINAEKIAQHKLILHLGSSSKLPFADASFNKIFCINVIYFWDNAAEHLQEIKRVLKPGGKFFATIRSKESMQQMPFTKYNFKMYTVGEWISLLQENKMNFAAAKQIDEPIVDFKGSSFQINSICLIAEKPAYN